MKYRLLILLNILSLGLIAQSSLQLEEAIAKGLTNNFSVVSIKKQQSKANINNAWGKAGALPTLDLNGAYSFSKEDDKISNADIRSLNTGVSLNWTLFNGFSIRINKNKLASLNELSMGNSAIIIENTIEDIILAYYTALLEKEKLKVSDKLFNLSKDRYDKITLQQDLGSSGTYELLQAKNSFLEDKSKYLLQESIYINSLRELNLLMGENSERKYELITAFTVTSNEYSLDELLKKMESSNNVLKNQYLSMRIDNLDIELAKSGYYPRLSFNTAASYLDRNTKTGNTASQTYERTSLSTSLNLSYNLFNGGNTKRAIRIAKIQKEIGEIGRDEMVLKLSNQLASSLEMYNVRKEIYLLAEENLKAAELNLQMSKERYVSGAISSFNYRDVQILYMNVAIERLNAIFKLIGMNTNLVKLTGGLISE